MVPKVLLLDIETAPNVIVHYGLKTYGRWISPSMIVKESYILCASWKWLGSPRVYSVRAKGDDDTPVLKKLSDVINKADAVVFHNGDSFDIKWINGELMLHGLDPIKPSVQIDTLKLAKRKFRLNSYTLDYLARRLGVGQKMFTDIQLWKDVINGSKSAFNRLVRYNKHDVVILEKVFERIKPFDVAKLNLNLFYGPAKVCPSCGSESIYKHGFVFTRVSIRQGWKCRDCGHWFQTLSKGLPR